jgi:hypothetical protein
MPYNTINPVVAVEAVVRWIQASQPTIQALSLFAGGWEGWARNQLALWLQEQLQVQLGNDYPLDVLTEAGDIPTGDGAIPVFEDPDLRADLVFNALSPIGGRARPPVVITELKCQTPKQPSSAFRRGLVKDVDKLLDVNPDIDNTFGAGNVMLMSLGICFNEPRLRPAPGFRIEQATNEYAVQWWSDPDLIA